MSSIGKGNRQSKVSLRKQWNMSEVMNSFRQFLYNKRFQIQRNQLDPKVQEALVWLISQGLTIDSKRAREPVNADTKQMYNLIANIVTSLWRARRKLAQVSGDANKAASRHIDAAFDALAAAKVEVKDHTGEKYVTGMALKVIAIQPNPSLRTDIITETIKPTIRYKDLLIQRGEVAVETPANEATPQGQNNK
jgi:hypothetical protein